MDSPDIVVITGATGGLGPAVVDVFVSRGDRAIAMARSEEKLRDLVARHGDAVRAEAVDLASRHDVDEVWARLDADGVVPRWVVNVAGGFRAGAITSDDADAYAAMLDINLATTWWSCRAAARRMKAGAGGAIVNVSSRAAIAPAPHAAAYGAAKAAVVKLTTDLAAEMADARVRVNAVLPSVIDTATNRDVMPAKARARAAAPEAIAAVIAFLCSDGGRAITGAAIPVEGGF